MEQIAIISDIHGNLEALKTVLADIKKRNINKIFCLGDIIAKGNHQQECIDLIKENCEVVIKGNCEEYFTKDVDLNNLSDIKRKRYLWNKSKIYNETRIYLQNLPYSFEFYMSGRLVRLIHSHPEDIYKSIGNIDKIERYYELFLPSKNTISDLKADVLVYGHIHTQNMTKIYNRVILNTGSVGNSFEIFKNETKDGSKLNTTLANYLILKGNYDSKDFNDNFSFEFVSLPYNIEKELTDNNSNTNIEYDSYEYEIKNGKYRDMSKVEKSFEIMGIDKDKI